MATSMMYSNLSSEQRSKEWVGDIEWSFRNYVKDIGLEYLKYAADVWSFGDAP